ncbi:hypothetical protein GCM10009623_08460 [Nocardioides aestuarii]|uniref:Uncharacterized protein n=1 Tax=Nocardioides aestuarii TaxID=252231 RepID=A0ABW4THU3_9ACTN
MTAHRYNPSSARQAVRKGNAGMTAEQRTERARKAAAARWRAEKAAKGEEWTPPAEDEALAAFYREVDEKYPGLPPVARTAAARALRTRYGRAG